MIKNLKTLYSLLVHLFLITALAFLISCEEDFLEKKPDKALVVPTTLKDFETLIYNDIRIMNQEPSIMEIASDDLFTTAEALESLTAIERNSYYWAEDIYQGSSVPDWERAYERVFYANVVLDGLKDITVNASNRDDWKRVKGGALFYRSYAFYNLTKVFTLPYKVENDETIAGIPLRLEADVNVKSVRANLKETYSRILSDLQVCATLLPSIADFKTQPSQASVFGLASRVYLAMHDFEMAGAYADSCLQLQNTLMDYNDLDGTKRSPFPSLNEEVIFHSTLLTYSYFFSSLTVIAPDLYNTYHEDDLRRRLFFSEGENGQANFRGSYNGNIIPFSGLATDEMYLTRAECRARTGDISGAMEDLNILMKSRWKEGTFQPFSASSKEAAIELILKERRKELVFRGLRWADLKRLNQYPKQAITLVRIVNQEKYMLPPGDLKYAFPIPDAEIEGSGLTQNPR